MTPDEEVRLRLLSDGPLYDEAVRFAAEKELHPAQVNGLLSFSCGKWGELGEYVKHQAERNWPERPGGGEHPTKTFYREMRGKLEWLRRQAQEWGFVPQGLSRAQEHERMAAIASRLALEFIQHLAAEILYRRGGR